ncbi:glycosyltransferase family 4 protein [Oceanithermus desulfurans]|uniref:Glycosyltransferase WbuB n=2 Tax=Oceanithermus desulfurans TaxID=227924 RepID=A0A511RM88_9DEIN|nr:glycosyltransferase family 4 protein [Oceanithermus desulfurans]MBB6030469.1 glycosyltransferase involved in cell wall biosynthesis [Oceanithermus desulfurans]GEM90760.1 glycosyltransferase WbuB [Oceanithermus desulfurans NBRC 100063]
MNLWLVNHYAILPQQAGGTRHYTLARELVERGHQVTIIASSFDHTTRMELHIPDGAPSRLEVVDGVRFLWLRTPPYEGNSTRRLWNTVAFARKVLSLRAQDLGGRPDVVLGSSPHLFAAWAAERLARRHRVPFVLEVRDLWPRSLVDLGNFSEGHPFIRWLENIERGLYRRARHIITLLPGAGEHIAQKGGDPDRIVWIPNGIDADRLPPPEPPTPKDAFELMYAGTHGLANGLQVILEAAERLQNRPFRFRLVGDGPDKPRLVEMAARMNLTNAVFEPPVPKSQIPDLLREAGAFLMVLRDSPVFRWGVSPNKLFDYMAAARPVIFSVNTPLNPVEAAGAGVTVPAEDADALAEAAIRLLSMSPEERWRMGLRGRKYVEDNHNLNRLSSRLESVLKDALDSR